MICHVWRIRMQLFTAAHFSLTVSFLILLRLLRIILFTFGEE